MSWIWVERRSPTRLIHSWITMSLSLVHGWSLHLRLDKSRLKISKTRISHQSSRLQEFKETSLWFSHGSTKEIPSLLLVQKVAVRISWSEIRSSAWNRPKLLSFIVMLKLQRSTLSKSSTKCVLSQLVHPERSSDQETARGWSFTWRILTCQSQICITLSS